MKRHCGKMDCIISCVMHVYKSQINFSRLFKKSENLFL